MSGAECDEEHRGRVSIHADESGAKCAGKGGRFLELVFLRLIC
jgi:hypothetical protein